MKRWFPLLLLLGALLGLIGQGSAFAHAMPVEKAEHLAAAASMSADCAKMMGLAKKQPETGKPCKGMTPDCVAKMGCAASPALLPPLASDVTPELRAMPPALAPAPPLVGRNFGPEPEPPARLG